MGEVSAGRQALDGAAIAAGTQATLNLLRQRPQVPREQMLPELTHSEMCSSWITTFLRRICCAHEEGQQEGYPG